MDVFGIDIAQITDLATQVADTNALHAIARVGDELFEMMVAVATVASNGGLGNGG